MIFFFSFFLSFVIIKTNGMCIFMNYYNDDFMDFAFSMKEMSTCARRGVGAVIVKDDVILGCGYNHTVRGSKACTSDTCIRSLNNIKSGTRQEFCMATHAEQMAMIEALKNGYDIKGSTIYVTDSLCVICSRLICEFELARVYYVDSYPDDLSFKILNNAGVVVSKVDKTNIKVRKKM